MNPLNAYEVINFSITYSTHWPHSTWRFFSFLTAMCLTTVCTRQETMANLLTSHANQLTLLSAECKQLADAAVKSFMIRRCKQKVFGTGTNITLHYNRKLYSGLSKSNFKDHYGDVVIKQCLGKNAELNEFSALTKCCEWWGRLNVSR